MPLYTEAGTGNTRSSEARLYFPCPNKLCGERHLLALGAGILRVSASGGLQAGSVQLANVHELRAEMRYLTNLRNLCEMFRYPSPENPGGRRGCGKIHVGSFNYLVFGVLGGS